MIPSASAWFRFLRAFIPIVAATAVAACGGSGGGGGSGSSDSDSGVSRTPVAINSGNASAVASSLFSGFGSTQGVSSDTSATSSSSTRQIQLFTQLTAEKSVLANRFSGQIGTLDVTTSLCADDGSVTVDTDDLNYKNFTFENCDEDGVIWDGTYFTTLVSGLYSGNSYTADVDYNLTLQETGLTATTISGRSRLYYAYDSTTVTVNHWSPSAAYELMYTTGADRTILSDFDLQYSEAIASGDGTWSYESTVASTLCGGSVVVQTTVPFQMYGSAFYPHSGQYLVSGANDSQLRFTVNGNESYLPPEQQVTIEVDAEGDGVFETTINTSWTDLLG